MPGTYPFNLGRGGAHLKKLKTFLDEIWASLDGLEAINYASVEISSAEILDLFTTPKTLIATPGAGKVLEIVSVLLAYDYNTTAYTVTDVGNLVVCYTDASGAKTTVNLAADGFLTLEVDALRLLMKLATNVTPVVNAALVLAVDGTVNPLVGNSPIHAKVAYRIHSAGL